MEPRGSTDLVGVGRRERGASAAVAVQVDEAGHQPAGPEVVGGVVGPSGAQGADLPVGQHDLAIFVHTVRTDDTRAAQDHGPQSSDRVGIGAIDIGGTTIKSALVGPDLQVGPEFRVPTPRADGPDAVVEAVRAVARRLDGIDALGVAALGLVDEASGRAVYSA